MENENWFAGARFGMFLHWGAYSAYGRGEWAFNRERMTAEEYRTVAERFRAENYDPAAWVQLAKQAGMRYMVLTAKHHDGFCLWNTDTTDFNAVKIGPHRDLVAEYVKAARAGGMKVGLYYSPADWHNPDYPDAYARDWPQSWPDEAARKRFVAYYESQLHELMTRYGKIDLLWYDGCIPAPLEGERINRLVKAWQPGILINNRNGDPCDFVCCEQRIAPPQNHQMWEACMTLNENWGYHSGDNAYKTTREVLRLLIEVAKDGGNLLLNAGPKPDGTLPQPATALLREVGEWLRKNGEAIYNSQPSPFSWGTSQRITVQGGCAYLHVYYDVNTLRTAEIANRVLRVTRLADGQEIRFTQDEQGRLTLFNLAQQDVVDVYRCVLAGEPQALRPQTSFWIPG